MGDDIIFNPSSLPPIGDGRARQRSRQEYHRQLRERIIELQTINVEGSRAFNALQNRLRVLEKDNRELRHERRLLINHSWKLLIELTEIERERNSEETITRRFLKGLVKYLIMPYSIIQRHVG